MTLHSLFYSILQGLLFWGGREGWLIQEEMIPGGNVPERPSCWGRGTRCRTSRYTRWCWERRFPKPGFRKWYSETALQTQSSGPSRPRFSGPFAIGDKNEHKRTIREVLWEHEGPRAEGRGGGVRGGLTIPKWLQALCRSSSWRWRRRSPCSKPGTRWFSPRWQLLSAWWLPWRPHWSRALFAWCQPAAWPLPLHFL